MEMGDIHTEKEREKEDEKENEPRLEVKTKEEAEPDHYAKLHNPAEDIYAEAGFGDSPVKTKAGKQTEGKARLYRAGCLFLTILCLILLLVVIILSIKLQTGSTVCPQGRKEEAQTDRPGPSVAATCSFEQCRAHCPNIQPYRLGCQQCADGWLTFGRSCFYLSTTRMSWNQSQRNCTARGGSLAVITSQQVQSFLSVEGNLNYWIGLRQQENKWKWVNNSVLQKSYWAENVSQGDCGILDSESPPEKNWIKASCKAHSYFICQLQF